MEEFERDSEDELTAQEYKTARDMLLMDRDSPSACVKILGKHSLLSPEKEGVLANRAREGDQEARDELILCNYRLVLSLARKAHKPDGPLSVMDLFQEGIFGLSRAVEKFDPDKGFRFTTYASWWIIRAISRAIFNHGSTIRKPIYICEMYNRYLRLSESLAQSLGREPTHEETAKAMGLSEKKLLALIRMGEDTYPLSTEAHIGLTDESGCLADFIADRGGDFKLDDLAVEMMLTELPGREREVIRLRFYEDMTIQETANVLGVSRVRVGKITSSALERLRLLAGKYDLTKPR